MSSSETNTSETSGLPDVILECLSEHTAKLQQAFSTLREAVRRELSAELGNEFEERFQQSMELAKEQFKQKFQETAAEIESERNHSRTELLEFRQRMSTVSAELVGKEAELAHLERETAAMLEDPEVEISRVIRNNALVTELRAYIRGLHVQVGTPTEK